MFQYCGDSFEDSITGCMTARVIDLLEKVEVDKNERVLAARPPIGVRDTAQPMIEFPMVHEIHE